MCVSFTEGRREDIQSFFQFDVACGVVHLKNGDSFAYYNGEFKRLAYSARNENIIMKSVCDIHEKLDTNQ